MEDLFESSVFDPEEPPQWGEEGAEKVYAEVYGRLIKWHKEDGREAHWNDNILCEIQALKPGEKLGDTVHFVHSKAPYGVLKIKPKFKNPPVHVLPNDVIALIMPWRLV